ncbi:MAG: carboxypeptidase-like regulatory domain-containing protein [Bacteroidales bacterium]|nr:carboxypeptidase-like regulatory domain-containing protein [Bacteroidales bacterium]
MKHLLIISLLLCCLSLKAQNDYHTIKGEIVSSDSLAPIPKAHILSELSHYGTTSDFDGKFSMPIKTIDTLRISSVGFVTEYIHINHDSIDANNFRILLQRDTIMLDEIDVIPYYNFSTVKEIVRTAPIVTPMHVVKEIEINTNIQNYYYNKTKDLPKTRGTWTIVFYNPIKKTYNRFNKKERLKRKLERNREKYLMD